MLERFHLLLACVVFGMTFPALAQSEKTTFASAPTRTHLLELFTSEGCSSCPPAEQWLSDLKDAPGLWKTFVPLAFHVDYWDRLGWRDPFATKAWTERQYRYAALWKNGSVYTPGFVLDGNEWRTRSVPSASNENVGVLKISLENGDRVSVRFDSAKKDARAREVHVARLGFGLKIHVKAGENNGRQLLHDFVVLSLRDAPLTNGFAELRLPAAESPATENGRIAIVAWVTESGQLTPLQATGGWQR